MEQHDMLITFRQSGNLFWIFEGNCCTFVTCS